jgi:hypothetical protein
VGPGIAQNGHVNERRVWVADFRNANVGIVGGYGRVAA